MPLKVNAAGVIPVIFAIAFIIAPRTVAGLFEGNEIAATVETIFDYTQPIGMVIYIALIIAFTYFIHLFKSILNKWQKTCRNKAVIFPGFALEKHGNLSDTCHVSLNIVGAIFLAAVSVLPILLGGLADLPQAVQIGGTSLLIVVGVALQTMKQLESQLVKRHYTGFIK